ncbi:hypothetical protein [Nocardia brevicatena]|uniref:hypothetical protein n=1 Tax=Nocardia brevicatena TaxID=37327 RepID=UPI0012F760BC|nr:hypothetical protein [Nocardia brevicatena]
MNTLSKFAGFALGLAVVFGIALGVDAAIGPNPDAPAGHGGPAQPDARRGGYGVLLGVRGQQQPADASFPLHSAVTPPSDGPFGCPRAARSGAAEHPATGALERRETPRGRTGKCGSPRRQWACRKEMPNRSSARAASYVRSVLPRSNEMNAL